MKYLILLLVVAVIKSQETSNPCSIQCEPFCRSRQSISTPMMNHMDYMRTKLTNCEPESPPFKNNNHVMKKYYVEDETPRNWFGAIQECVKYKGHLAHLESELDYETVLEKLEYRKHYWIDINDLNKKDSYYSMTTGFRAPYFKWHQGEPNNYEGNERCIELRSRDNLILMNDKNCTAHNLFVCEIWV